MTQKIVTNLWFDGEAEQAAELYRAVRWLKDKYGLSWQVVPAGMAEIFADPDPERSHRAMQAMLGMVKLDVTALRSATDGA